MKEEDGSDGSREYPCIVRVTDGKKTKFSTKVNNRSFARLQYVHDTPTTS
jgi:hypothetical protein